MNVKILAFLILCFTSVVLPDDFKTVEGKEYKNATVVQKGAAILTPHFFYPLL